MLSDFSRTEAPFRLVLEGAVRLEHRHSTVRIGKKGLALLARLALAGPIRREEAADLLWDGLGANANLRVLLSRLRRVFREFGYVAFEPGLDPLVEPEYVSLEPLRGSGDLLAGLETLSSGLATWVGALRSEGAPGDRSDEWAASIADSLLLGSDRPKVFILEAEPGFTTGAVARTLANGLGLPLRPSEASPKHFLCHIRTETEPVPALQTIGNADGRVWLLERSSFGEDPEWLMALRSGLPADALRYRRMPPLSWHAARVGPLRDLAFAEAARLYVHSGGHPGYLDDLLALRVAGPLPRLLPTPKRSVSGYLLEARRTLHAEARRALERLAVHPGPLQPPLVRVLEAEEHLDELERQRWLVFDGDWRFPSEAARASLYAALPAGQRRRWHLRAEHVCDQLGDQWSREYHHLHATDPSSEPAGQERIVRAVVGTSPVAGAEMSEVELKGELALDAPRTYGALGIAETGSVAFVRDATRHAQSWANWCLPEQWSLARLSIDVWVPHYLAVDHEPEPIVQVSLRSDQPTADLMLRPEAGLHHSDSQQPQQIADEGVTMCLLASPGAVMHVSTRLPRGLVVVSARAHRLVHEGATRSLAAMVRPGVLARL